MRRLIHLATGIAALSLSPWALGQAPVAYPAKGQSPQQQQKDEGECHVWAKKNTGIDPAVVAQTPATPQQSQPGGERARGAARGALGGAAIGAIAGDTGKGAGAGAVLGTMRGGREARSNEAARQQQAQTQQQQKIDTFYRAYGSCMQGRGYAVN
ncbi:MAG: hypothetical protein H6R10_2299 [Rhodocyclaceae bacterium]|nr:hypothetical protein [Rhodocyclaceae bacterium]